ncbi:MAG: glycosyltransferase [Candidatus Binataceae bacterium]
MDLSVVLPVINERENVIELIPRLKQRFERDRLDFEIIVVDGGSRDGTQAAAEAMGARVVRERRKGYGGALETGLAEARGDYILTLDADLSHDPDFVQRMWEARSRGDVVVASRYVRGGSAGGPLPRRALSRLLNFTLRIALSMPVRDLSSGFRLYRRAALEGIKLEGRNFEVLEEVLVKAYARGAKLIEVPFSYLPRGSGRSHARVIRFGVDLARATFKLRKVVRAGRHVMILALALILASMIASCASKKAAESAAPAKVSMGPVSPLEEVVSASTRGKCRLDAMKICQSFAPTASSDAENKTVSLAIPNDIAPLEVRCEYAGKGGALVAAKPASAAPPGEDEEAFLQAHGLCADPQAR